MKTKFKSTHGAKGLGNQAMRKSPVRNNVPARKPSSASTRQKMGKYK